MMIRKVCHILRCFSPSQWGGIESAVYHLSSEQSKAGIEAEIVATDAFSSPGEELFEGVHVSRFSAFYP